MEIKLHGNFGPRPGSKGESLAKENFYCSAGKDVIAIDPQNRIYGCPFSMLCANNTFRYIDGEIVIKKELLLGYQETCISDLLE